MTKRIYFKVVNVAEDAPLAVSFFQSDTHSDLAGYVTSCAKAWMVSPDDVRMFVFATKKEWEDAAIEYAGFLSKNR